MVPWWTSERGTKLGTADTAKEKPQPIGLLYSRFAMLQQQPF